MLKSFTVAHKQVLCIPNTRFSNFNCLQHSKARNCTCRRKNCVARGWDSLSNLSDIAEKKHKFVCRCLKVVALSGCGKNISSISWVKIPNRCVMSQQWIQVIVSIVLDRLQTSFWSAFVFSLQLLSCHYPRRQSCYCGPNNCDTEAWLSTSMAPVSNIWWKHFFE